MSGNIKQEHTEVTPGTRTHRSAHLFRVGFSHAIRTEEACVCQQPKNSW